jgi:hypothetical protein
VSTKTLVSLISDIDGSTAEDTISFGLDGQAYEIDLSAEQAAALRDGLAPYVGAARRSNGSPVRRGRGARVVRREPASAPPRASASAPIRPSSSIAHVAEAHVDGAERRSAVRAWARGPGAIVVAAAGLDPVADRGRLAVRLYELYDARAR